jgi:glutaredoxin
MEAKAEADKVELSRLTSERLRSAELAAKKSADDKLPLPNGAIVGAGGGQAPVLGGKGQKKTGAKVEVEDEEDEGDSESVGKTVPGGKTVENTEAQHLEDEKEAEKSAATVELAGILKKGPGTLQSSPETHMLIVFNAVIIFSKTYCPYSIKAKTILLEKYKIVPEPFVVELNQHELGPQLQDELLRLTGRRSVPNILINGKSIGGGDDIAALHQQGELADTVKKLGGPRVVEVVEVV